jgi:hypothetical protein
VTRQRVSTDICAKCRKKFLPSNRITMAYIVEKAGHLNPQNPFEGGSMLSPDFELVHISCIDPNLDKGLALPE